MGASQIFEQFTIWALVLFWRIFGTFLVHFLAVWPTFLSRYASARSTTGTGSPCRCAALPTPPGTTQYGHEVN